MNEELDRIVRNIGYYVSIKQLKNGIDSLSTHERIFFIVYDFEMELINGYADQYFVNSSGDNANEVPYAMSAIGAIKSVELAKELLSYFPEHQVPKNRGDRLNFLTAYWNDAEYIRMIEDVSSKYCKDEDGIFTLLYNFFDENRQEFDPYDFDVPFRFFKSKLE